MSDFDPRCKPRRHPRDPNLTDFLREIRTTRQAYLGITEKMRVSYQDALDDLNEDLDKDEEHC